MLCKCEKLEQNGLFSNIQIEEQLNIDPGQISA